MNDFNYVRSNRQMPWIKRGMRVVVNGKEGRVTCGNSCGNINVKFPDSRHSRNCHPQWETVYYDKIGNVIADYRLNREAPHA